MPAAHVPAPLFSLSPGLRIASTPPAVKRVEKAIRAKVQLQQGQDENDEEELGNERPGSHVWGKSNKALYGADTQDYEVTLPRFGQALGGIRPAVQELVGQQLAHPMSDVAWCAPRRLMWWPLAGAADRRRGGPERGGGGGPAAAARGRQCTSARGLWGRQRRGQ